jgi:hypothetical protein
MIAPEEQDTVQALWHRRYMCKLRQIDTMSQDHMEYFGTPTTGDPELDKQMLRTLVKRALTPIQMMELVHQHKSVYLIDPKDTLEIYNSIDIHLKRWKTHIESGVNNRKVPEDDLILMDTFAKTLFPYASRYFPKGNSDELQTQFDRAIMNNIPLRPEDILAPMQAGVTVNKIDEKVEECASEHVSMAELFASRAAASVRGGGSRWK